MLSFLTPTARIEGLLINGAIGLQVIVGAVTTGVAAGGKNVSSFTNRVEISDLTLSPIDRVCCRRVRRHLHRFGFLSCQSEGIRRTRIFSSSIEGAGHLHS